MFSEQKQEKTASQSQSPDESSSSSDHDHGLPNLDVDIGFLDEDGVKELDNHTNMTTTPFPTSKTGTMPMTRIMHPSNYNETVNAQSTTKTTKIFTIDNESNSTATIINEQEERAETVESTFFSLSSLYLARRLLYISHLGNQFSEWTWQFCLVFWLAQITQYKSLLLVSTYEIVGHVMVGTLATLLGRWIDTMALRGKRLLLAQRLLAIENGSVIVATMACFWILQLTTIKTNITTQNSQNDQSQQEEGNFSLLLLWPKEYRWRVVILLVVVHLLGGLARVMDKAFLVAVERDWIVALAQTVKKFPRDDNDDFTGNENDFTNTLKTPTSSSSSLSFLSETNVVLKQMDLTCQILAPVLSGLILSFFSSRLQWGMLWVGTVHVLALVGQWICVTQIVELVPSLERSSLTESSASPMTPPSLQVDSNPSPLLQEADKDVDIRNDSYDDDDGQRLLRQSQGESQGAEWSIDDDDTAISSRTSHGWKQGFEIYMSQSVSMAGLGLALLYFNVLTFSGMMTAYLVSKGMQISTVGIWRAVSSMIGLFSTLIYHQSIKFCSLQMTALWSIAWEFAFLTLTFCSIYVPEDDPWLSMRLLIAGVLPSRIGLWVFDIAVTQLFQQSVPESLRGQVGGTQMSLNAWMELCPFGLALLYHKPSEFYILIVGGYLAVGLAVLLYLFGYYVPHRSLIRRRRRSSVSEEFQLVPIKSSDIS